MRDQGIGSWTTRRARMSPDQVAVVGEGREWTYRQLHERATRFAHALAGLGVGAGDRVAYLGPNHVAFLETLFGTAKLGAIFVPLNTRLTPNELAYMLADSGAAVLVHAPSHAEHADALRGMVRIPHVVDLDEHARLVAQAPVEPLDEPVGQDEVAMIMYTSGTTGHPKGAALTHGNIQWNSVNLLIDVDLAGDEVTLVNAPMFHVAALNQTVLPTMLKGGTVVLMPAFDPEGTLELIERHRVTYLFGVPAIFAAVAASRRWAEADLSSVRTLICGGAPVPHQVITTYQERGLVFLQGYGLTESSPSASFLRTRESREKAGSAGTPCFFTDMRVVGPDGEQVPPGTPGEVVLHGPNVMRGYWGKPAETAAVLSADGWLRTGDVAVSDEDGYLYVRDRIKDVIISGGENVYPAEVEDALHKHPAVADCAVIGVADERWGEVGRAVVVLREGAGARPEELLEFLDGRIARYKIPKSVTFAGALPRTASGKLLKSQLRTTYGGQR
ncbi:acyl-CoA synthetase [Actinophytocola xanthii]|uniref:p-hydroxycinnamoyl-CoA synthetase n=1 Tax=Actinophytocola xanthii TaxID=1912961 RepID=A0A1Q8CW14_9PSEU|nr:long-chain fatty acid--CoA ligase [Actinophytocola xanthii]OLF18543.1 p-hydroxycinnamoyl-CoA synthetase [Actinophytocola xanthii]